MDGEPEREITRVPTDADLVSLARELNRLGVAEVVVGGFAFNRLGFVRATEDIDLLIARDLANQTLVKRALEILPDRAGFRTAQRLAQGSDNGLPIFLANCRAECQERVG